MPYKKILGPTVYCVGMHGTIERCSETEYNIMSVQEQCRLLINRHTVWACLQRPAIAEAVSCRFLMLQARVHAQGRPARSVDDQLTLGQVFV
jgi:hypothetical protein